MFHYPPARSKSLALPGRSRSAFRSATIRDHIASRWACRVSIREARIASTFSSGSSAVAKLRRFSRTHPNAEPGTASMLGMLPRFTEMNRPGRLGDRIVWRGWLTTLAPHQPVERLHVGA